MREWGKVINVERAGTPRQATCYRLRGRLTGFRQAVWLAESTHSPICLLLPRSDAADLVALQAS